ncbi:MAG: hypothetical protein CEE38_05425 [Planctomycetes bacterium B3_Pla]|nr:MAG: hypothetical protein CEE38_05425 [Planctomycetes bacterium B3_Pla]
MKLNKRKSKKFRRGSILAFVVVIGLCLALLGMGMLQMGFGSRLNSHISVSVITAREAADAGIAKALYSMNAAFPTPDWAPTGSGTLPNSNASYSYEITVPPYAEPRGAYFDHYEIKSIGTSDRDQRIIYTVTGIRNFLDYGLIVTNTIDLKSDTLLDGYDTRLGPYTEFPDTTNSHAYIRIGTTSIAENAIWLHQDTWITGDVLTGIGGDVYEVIQETPTGGSITGPWYSLPEPWSFDPIIIPDAVYIPSGSIGNSTPWDGTGSYRVPAVVTGEKQYFQFDNIDVPTGQSLIFLGPVDIIITGNLELDNAATLYVGEPFPDLEHPAYPLSSLTIYLYGDLLVRNGGNINNLSRIPLNFQLYGVGPPYQDWDIYNSGDYYGIYYGPNANIRTYATAEFYGSISGHDFLLFNGGQLHYDRALADLTAYDTGFGIDSWWEQSGL